MARSTRSDLPRPALVAGLSGALLMAGCAGGADQGEDSPTAASPSVEASLSTTGSPGAAASPTADPSPESSGDPSAAPSASSTGTRDIVMGDYTITVPQEYSAQSEGPSVTLTVIPNSRVTIELGTSDALGGQSVAQFCDSFVPPQGVAAVSSEVTPIGGLDVCTSQIDATTPQEVQAVVGGEVATAEAMGSLSSTQLVLLSPDGTQAVRVHGIHVPVADGGLEADIAAQFAAQMG